MQIEDVRKNQEKSNIEDNENMRKLSEHDSGHSGWQEVDTSQEGEKEMLDQIKERMGGMEDIAKKNHEKELEETGSTMFETEDEQGRPITVEAIDPESDLGKKILKEQKEKKKHGRSD